MSNYNDEEIIDPQEQIGDFLREKTVARTRTQSRVPYADLYDVYVRWTRARGEFPESKHIFGKILRETFDMPMKSFSRRVDGKVTSIYCILGLACDEVPDASNKRLSVKDREIARLKVENLEMREAICTFAGVSDFDAAITKLTASNTPSTIQE
ncbi:hypothetical protein KNU02_gp02 [Gordonia phage Pleakley]|uniref:DNA primase/nucleoside triphosphatase C-terminal domain-containing protein n=1 Tax=Gordonia phage Pleakley TaxID=2283246 RepID=A0A345M6C0_9CAUD|nr:hypothetical protein KNU02_gp02 [Gordonia phage Pleakley]AXH49728.1 hypothetical protein SEA_FURY_2 [Gordonia phage Fury]AXH66041.1 hypothetical protein SEA_PLEAKLEY_2 [Gordonia phage Pleakley]